MKLAASLRTPLSSVQWKEAEGQVQGDQGQAACREKYRHEGLLEIAGFGLVMAGVEASD